MEKLWTDCGELGLWKCEGDLSTGCAPSYEHFVDNFVSHDGCWVSHNYVCANIFLDTRVLSCYYTVKKE